MIIALFSCSQVRLGVKKNKQWFIYLNNFKTYPNAKVSWNPFCSIWLLSGIVRWDFNIEFHFHSFICAPKLQFIQQCVRQCQHKFTFQMKHSIISQIETFNFFVINQQMNSEMVSWCDQCILHFMLNHIEIFLRLRLNAQYVCLFM